MENIIAKTRDIIEDNLKYMPEVQEYYGGVKIFKLVNDNISESSLKVYKNGTLLTSGYSYNSDSGEITITASLVSGDSLKFTYNTYEKYSDNELAGYIRSSLYRLTTEQYKTFAVKPENIIFPTPSESEEDLIALIASTLIKGSVRSYKTPEFSIQFEEGLSTDEKIKNLIMQFNKSYGDLDYIDPTADIVNLEDE